VDATVEPRFAGLTTFFRLPTREQVAAWDVGVVGIPFDAGTSYRPGARFGPSAVRQGSRLLRTYHPDLEVSPFAAVQVVDAGDIACTPFNIETAVVQIEAAADRLLTEGSRLVAVGGDHTVALPLLRSVVRRHGPVALVHFDAHLDTWDTYFGGGPAAPRPRRPRGHSRTPVQRCRPGRRRRHAVLARLGRRGR
jgi:agmatinase